MNGVTMNSEPHDCGEWTKFNLDTGAAQTAIPKSWNAIQWTPGTTVTFKTASAELVPSERTGSYVGSDENGLQNHRTNSQCAQTAGISLQVSEQRPSGSS